MFKKLFKKLKELFSFDDIVYCPYCGNVCQELDSYWACEHCCVLWQRAYSLSGIRFYVYHMNPDNIRSVDYCPFCGNKSVYNYWCSRCQSEFDVKWGRVDENTTKVFRLLFVDGK